MLADDEARTRLDALADPAWRDEAHARAERLPPPLRAIATGFLTPGHRTDGSEGVQLDGRDPEDVLTVTTALHPELGPDLATWWHTQRAAPYTVAPARRAPRNPEVTRSMRTRDLHSLVEALGPYRQPAAWLAGWAGYVGRTGFGYSHFGHALAGPLLAAGIERQAAAGGREVLDELLAVVRGEHPVGTVGRPVVVALLRSGVDEGVDSVERLLLARRDEEGLRQLVLEAAEEAHPTAFGRLLDLVLDHGLLRFAGTVSVAGGWLGATDDRAAPDGGEPAAVAARLARLRTLLADPAAARTSVAADEPWAVHAGLSALAIVDVDDALAAVDGPRAHPSVDVRAAAARFLGSVGLRASDTRLVAMIDDPDPAVAVLAGSQVDWRLVAQRGEPDGFDALERLIVRLPARAGSVPAVGVEQQPVALDRRDVADAMVAVLGDRPKGRMAPWLTAASPLARQALLRAIKLEGTFDADGRAVVLRLLGDRSRPVRQAALSVLGEVDLTTLATSELEALEALLTRTTADLRRGVMGLLARQPPAALAATVRRLWRAGHRGQREAACELLTVAVPPPPELVVVAADLLAVHPTADQRVVLQGVVGVDPPPTVGPGLGLFDPAGMTPPTPPRARPAGALATDVSRRLVRALDAVAEQHGDDRVPVGRDAPVDVRRLADISRLPNPFMTPADDPAGGLLLGDAFATWWDERPDDLREAGDGVDALRALTVSRSSTDGLSSYDLDGPSGWLLPLWAEAVGGTAGALRHRVAVEHVLLWVLATRSDGAVVDEALDGFEATLAAIPPERHEVLADDGRWSDDWRGQLSHRNPWQHVLYWLFRTQAALFDEARVRRWLGLLRWVDEPTPEATRRRPPTLLVATAHAMGVATDDDVYDALFCSITTLRHWSRRRRQPYVDAFPAAVALADRLRDRILEVEPERGELPTPASVAALDLASVEGAEIALDLLARLGRDHLVRGRIGGDTSRDAVFSHLLRVSYASATDTPDRVGAAADRLGLVADDLVALALYAPQWAELAEGATGWDGLADAVWWYHAHIRHQRWEVDAQTLETWTALAGERTPLAGDDLLAGAVDVGWFRRAHGALGPERWAVVHEAAARAAGGAGPARARLFADALTGRIDADAVIQRAVDRRHKDSMRAIGLLPLPDEPAGGEAVARRRYGVLRELERGAARFGPQRRESERTAVRVGIENLARTAGAVDVSRFVWAMEVADGADLADLPVAVVAGDVTVTLSVDDAGEVQLDAARAGAPLRSVPRVAARTPAVAALEERATALIRQSRRVRAALEAMMVAREPFTADDLAVLGRHPLVAPLLALLVFVDEVGRTLRLADGPTDPARPLRIAHPVDLAASGDRHAWRERLEGRSQPFEQVLRALHVPGDDERDGTTSPRWEGHEIPPRQGLARFGARGWLGDRDQGELARTFHADDVVARIGIRHGWATPADGERPTLGALRFTRRGSSQPLPLAEVPAVVFSEAWRDLDLVTRSEQAPG